MIQIERHVEQRGDTKGLLQGYVEINGVRFDFQLQLAGQLEDMDVVATTIRHFRRIFCLTLKRGETELFLSNREFTFFLVVLLEAVSDLLDRPVQESGDITTREVTDILPLNDTRDLRGVLGRKKFGIRFDTAVAA